MKICPREVETNTLIVPIMTPTQTQRMCFWTHCLHLHLSHHKHNIKVYIDVNSDANANVTCEQGLTRSMRI